VGDDDDEVFVEDYDSDDDDDDDDKVIVIMMVLYNHYCIEHLIGHYGVYLLARTSSSVYSIIA